jgi:WD40 repeat protein
VKVAINKPKTVPRGTVSLGTLDVVDVASGKTVFTATTAPGVSADSIHFTPDGTHVVYPREQTLAEGRADQRVFAIADLIAGKVTGELRLSEYDWVNVFSPDGKLALTGYQPQVWDMATRARVCELELDPAERRNYRPVAACFVPNNASVLAVGPDLSVSEWNAQTGKRVRTTKPQKTYRGQNAAFSADGSVFYVRARGAIQAFDSKTVQSLGFWRHGLTTNSVIVGLHPESGLANISVKRWLETDKVAVVNLPHISTFTE